MITKKKLIALLSVFLPFCACAQTVLTSAQQVDFILSDTRGMVHRSLSHTGEAGVSQTVDINYGGLRRGQYVLYICVNGKQYAEKFNVQ